VVGRNAERESGVYASLKMEEASADVVAVGIN
jgi:hypothetical protein